MTLDEILINLDESAVCEAEHPEGCECEKCKKHPEDCDCPECVEECSETQNFWEEAGIDESEEKELEAVNSKMRKLMAKRSECAPGSEKQELINDELDKIYDRRHELMSKEVLTEDGEGSKVLEALEEINTEETINEELSGEETSSEEDGNPWSVENQNPDNRYMLDAVTSPVEKIEYEDEPVEECSKKVTEADSNAEAGAKIGASLGNAIGKGLDQAKAWGKRTAEKVKTEFGKAHDALQKDAVESGLKEDKEQLDEFVLAAPSPVLMAAKPVVPTAAAKPAVSATAGKAATNLGKAAAAEEVGRKAYNKARVLRKVKDGAIEAGAFNSVDNAIDDIGGLASGQYDLGDVVTSTATGGLSKYFGESVYKVSKTDGSNEYIMAESAEKFADYINESFEDIVAFEKINTEALNESMDHEVVDTIVTEFKNEPKVSLADIQARVSEMIDDSMSEEFVKTIFNKIVNTLKNAGIEVAE